MKIIRQPIFPVVLSLSQTEKSKKYKGLRKALHLTQTRKNRKIRSVILGEENIKETFV